MIIDCFGGDEKDFFFVASCFFLYACMLTGCWERSFPAFFIPFSTLLYFYDV